MLSLTPIIYFTTPRIHEIYVRGVPDYNLVNEYVEYAEGSLHVVYTVYCIMQGDGCICNPVDSAGNEGL